MISKKRWDIDGEHVCSICSVSFTNEGILHQHLRRRHTSELPYGTKQRPIMVSSDDSNGVEDDVDYVVEDAEEDEEEDRITKAKKGKKRAPSEVWKHIDVSRNPAAYTCRYCTHPFRSGSTSNMKTHLKKYHPVQFEGSASDSHEWFEDVVFEEVEMENVLGDAQGLETSAKPTRGSLPSKTAVVTKGKGRINVWTLFSKQGGDAYCNHCDFSTHYRRNTPNLLRHLLKDHKNVVVAVDSAVTSVRGPGGRESAKPESPSSPAGGDVQTAARRNYATVQTPGVKTDFRINSSRLNSRGNVSKRRRSTRSTTRTSDEIRRLDEYEHHRTVNHSRDNSRDPARELSDFLRFSNSCRAEEARDTRARKSLSSINKHPSSVVKHLPSSASNAHFLLSLLPFMNWLSPENNMDIRIELQNAFMRRLFPQKKPATEMVQFEVVGMEHLPDEVAANETVLSEFRDTETSRNDKETAVPNESAKIEIIKQDAIRNEGAEKNRCGR